MIALISVALADPAACNPQTTSHSSDLLASGFCLTEREYVEIGRDRAELADLKSQVAARSAEVAAFEVWKTERDAAFRTTVETLTAASTTALDRADATCNASLAAARKRSLTERNGFALGLVVGVVATVGTTALALQTYGQILN